MATAEYEFELKVIINGKNTVKMWVGKDGEDAAKRYADCHSGHTVLAWRNPTTHLGIGVNPRQIIG